MTKEIKYLSNNTPKEQSYTHLLPQIKAVLDGEEDHIARISTVMAIMHEAFGFLWVGVYFVKGENLVVGPYQGPIACTRIGYGKGVCGKSWELKKPIIVPDVDKISGHIACSSLSRSEMVVPSLNESGQVEYLIDIDSKDLSAFDEMDLKYVQDIIKIINEVQ